MNQDFVRYLQECKARVDAVLPELLRSGAAGSEYAASDARGQLQRLNDACLYSLTNGGKRVRATLVYATAAALGRQPPGLDAIAAAIEMLHAYSLVHDDLPAMDNDVLRRGQPTCHIAFDEATAILVGDALQSRAFELLATLPGDNSDRKIALVRELAAAAGPRGMVGGQAIDLAAVDTTLDLAALKNMHQLKTGALIRSAIAMAAHWCGAEPPQREALDDYGLAVGLAFQVQDDILDIEGETAILGKTQGADQALNKPTYPALLGLKGARELAFELRNTALAALNEFDHSAWPLRELAEYIVARRH